MSSYVKPQVLVFQEFSIVPTEITEPLRAHIAGPNAVLHRYTDSDEKQTISLGVYNPEVDTCYPWPQRLPGSRVDQDYVKLHVDKALLKYYEHSVGASGVVISPVDGKDNWIEANTLAFKDNGSYGKSDAFNDRDVKVGDVVYLRSVTGESCDVSELWTEVTGFASTPVDSRIRPATSDNQNQNTVSAGSATAATSAPSATPGADGYNYLQIAGPKNEVNLTTVTTSAYDGLAHGLTGDTYTIQVVKSSVAGCASAVLRVRSASGLDDVATVTPTIGTPVEIGANGLTVTFTLTEDTVDSGVPAAQFVIGQKWEVTVQKAFVAVSAFSEAAGAYTIDNSEDPSLNGDILARYTGTKHDTYIVEVTKGGLVSGGGDGYPEITVKTAKGLDFSGPTEITDADETGAIVPVGTRGVQVRFEAPAGFRKGDKFYIKVVSGVAGWVRRLILRDDLPTDMLDASEVDLSLFIKDDIHVSKNRLGQAPLTNYWLEDTQICVQEGVTAFHPEWTLDGVEQPLPVVSGQLYVTYREWVSSLADEVNSISDVADLDQIPGQLDIDNPLKWGVYKALSNSNGTVVKYTAVAEPDDLDSWVQVLERIKGRDDMYNLVPLTFNRLVHNLWAAHIGAESNEYANNWKGGFFALQAQPHKLVVGEGALIADVLGNVIADPTLATLSDDPNATGTDQYTLLQVPPGTSNTSGYFITNQVQPGDIVRYNYVVDGFGDEQYEEYVVDQVLSENSLLLYTGGTAAITQPQRFEIWHNRDRNEIADDIATAAGGYGNRRVCAVWPDQVGEAGVVQPGFYLAAALGGLVSGVVPHQPLTNVEVAGFDDFSRSYKYFNETQLNRMAEAGVWIVTEDKDGTPFSRHALTTDNLDLNRREEMIRRNVDSMSYLFLRRLRPYIGRTNAQEGMIRRLTYEVTSLIDFLKANGNTEELGSQLIDGTITKLQIHPLLKDRIEIVLDLTVPAPLNNIELHLVV
jgi:hypothetical protein